MGERPKPLVWRTGVPSGTAGSNPAPSANACARWGASGPLNPQPAIVELKGVLREEVVGSVPGKVVLRVEPSAAHASELRQAWKGAAVSKPLRVLEDRLT